MRRFFKIIYILYGILLTFPATGEENPQETVKNTSHGGAPESQWDVLIMGGAAIIVIVTLVLSIKYLWKPGENSPDHIKNIVIDNY